MAQKQLVELTFDDSEGPVNASELGTFLLMFGNVHDVVAELFDHIESEQFRFSLSETDHLRSFITDEGVLGFIQSAMRSGEQGFVMRPEGVSQHNALQIEGISKSSPLRMTMLCIPIALTAAVILSGGEIDMPGFKCKVPPIGVGLESIITILSSPPTAHSHGTSR
jgi:hypothetical protein